MLQLELRRNSQGNNAVATISRTYGNCPVSITKPLLYQLSYASEFFCNLTLEKFVPKRCSLIHATRDYLNIR